MFACTVCVESQVTTNIIQRGQKAEKELAKASQKQMPVRQVGV